MISIIGAGPIGSYLAYLLAKAGQKVALFEEHKEIGKPVQCTGIVTEDIDDIIKLDKKVIANITSKAKIISNDKEIVIDTKEIILYRDKFDKFLLDQAVKAGAKLYKGYKYERFDSNLIYFSNKKTFRTDILIGADGPNSKVARTNGMLRKREFYVGVQARVKTDAEHDTYKVFLDDYYPDFFAWTVPEDKNIVRLGIAAKNNPDLVFENLIRTQKINTKNIIEKQGGLIPIYSPKQRLQNKNVFLVGDAAAQVKASTGGGLIPGLKSAKILADCIINKKDYTKEFKKTVGKSLWLHLKIRDMLNSFTAHDYDILFDYINQKKIRGMLSRNTRENPLKLLIKMLVLEPRFLRFISKAKL